MKKIITIILAAFLPVLSVSAHPGHGIVEDGPLHYILSIEHAVPIVIFAFIIYYFVRTILQKDGYKNSPRH
jgi:hypothetical protein